MKFVTFAFAAAMAATPAMSAEIVVQMLNRGEAGAMVFEPSLIVAEVGDTVRFVPTDRGHNAETIDGFLPDGVAPVIGAMNAEMVIEVTSEGLYGIRCKPHYGMGMVALIVAGDDVDAAIPESVSAPRKAKEAFEAMLAGL